MKKLLAALVLAVSLTGCDTPVMSPQEATVRVAELVQADAPKFEELAVLKAKSAQLSQVVFLMVFAGVVGEADVKELLVIDTLDYYHAVATKALYERDEPNYKKAVLVLKDLHSNIEAKLQSVARRYADEQDKKSRIVW